MRWSVMDTVSTQNLADEVPGVSHSESPVTSQIQGARPFLVQRMGGTYSRSSTCLYLISRLRNLTYTYIEKHKCQWTCCYKLSWGDGVAWSTQCSTTYRKTVTGLGLNEALCISCFCLYILNFLHTTAWATQPDNSWDHKIRKR